MAMAKIFFQGKVKTYIKLPEAVDGERIDFSVIVPKDMQGKYLVLSVADEKRNVPAKASCNEDDCNECHVVYCPVYQGFANLCNVEPGEKSIQVNLAPTIPGHPNCHYGECEICHVVSCSRHQWDFPETSEISEDK